MQVFITGVSSGIGLGLVHEYLRRGDQVAGVSRRTPEIANDRFQFHSVDLTDSDTTRTVVQQSVRALGGVDLAILNAGVIGRISDMPGATIDEMKQTMDINLWANKTVMDALLELPEPPKQIVAISSGASVNGHRGWNGYTISKAALNMLTVRLASAYAGTARCVVSMSPGWVRTDMGGPAASLSTTESVERMLKTIDTLTDANSGHFIDNQGNSLPW